MGIYLSEPKKDKTTHTGSNDRFEFTATAMQGWRMSMEDSHIAELDIEKDTHVFGVFDGHGGREVNGKVKVVAKGWRAKRARQKAEIAVCCLGLARPTCVFSSYLPAKISPHFA